MSRTRRTLLLALALAAVSAAGIAVSGAALGAGVDVGLTPEVGEAIGLGTTDIRVTVARIIRNFMGLLGIVAVLLILYGGWLWMTSQGEEEKVNKAKQVLTAAVIGLAIILASVAIAQFVLRSLAEATGITQIGGGGGGGPAPGSGLPAGSFYVQKISPDGAVPIRNVVVRVVFSRPVDATTVQTNVTVTGPGGAVPGTFATKDTVVEFTPTASCPAPNDDRKCFDADADFLVTVAAGLKSATGQVVSCGGLAPACSGSFHTGTLVDTAPPTVTIEYPDEGGFIPENTPDVQVQVHATDDAAISYVDTLADGTSFGKATPNPGVVTDDFLGSVLWDTTGVTLGSHSLSAQAYDVDTNWQASKIVHVSVLPAHCFNGSVDADETGKDCGGSCAACSGSACTQGSQCASGVCQNGLCVDQPVVTSVTPGKAAPGNFVTITGKFFGAQAGTVTFLGAGTPVDASLCDPSAWKDDEITVVVPAGAADGPIRVTAANALADATNDERGPLIDDFDVDPTATGPSICTLAPTSGQAGAVLTLTGKGFGASQGAGKVVFAIGGKEFAVTQADAWADAAVQVKVPTLNVDSPQTTLVRVVQAGDSNQKGFLVQPLGAGTKPRIDAVDPPNGPIGEYVTFRGANFGFKPGVVTFKLPDQTTAIGDTSFPPLCGTNFWADGAVTVKVPSAYQDLVKTAMKTGAHAVQVQRASDGALSNAQAFTVTTTVPGPGICALIPDNGPPLTTKVNVVGERFGTVPGSIKFTKEVTVGGVPGQWQDQSIVSAVPADAATGPVAAYADGNPKQSNGVPFAVGACTSDAQCAQGRICCGDGSCRLSCAGVAGEGAYFWRISTGLIPKLPEVVEEIACANATQSPSPYRGTRDGCVNADVTARFTVPMESASLLAPGTFAVYACGGSEAFATTACDRTKPLAGALWVGTWNPEGASELVFDTAADLAAGTWYEAVILSDPASAAGARSVPGLYLDGDRDGAEGGEYRWQFRSRVDATVCEIDHVQVQPAQSLLEQKGATLDYRAFPTAANCNALSCGSYAWQWQSLLADGTPPVSPIAPLAPVGGEPACVQRATAERESPPGNPVHETAIALVSPTDPSKNKADFGELTVAFRKPEVIDRWPDCTAACVNAGVGGTFSTWMDPTSVTDAIVRLYECDNEACTTFAGLLNPQGPNAAFSVKGTTTEVKGSPHVTGFVISPNAGQRLKKSTWYRVVVQGGPAGARAETGAQLVGLNYGLAYSWKFRVRDDDTLCDVARVTVEPSKASVYVVGDVATYAATPWSKEDSQCGAMRLTATDYGWSWSAKTTKFIQGLTNAPTPTVATLDMGGGKDIEPFSPELGCVTQCLNTGSRNDLPVCGNGIIEATEDCDDGNATGGDGCSAKCLAEGAMGGAVCGNGQVERGTAGSTTGPRGEDCDDGNATGGDGCSAKCLAEGSGFAAPLCGNGKLDTGEACDDGNLAAGDGCNQACVFEGSVPGKATCGNGTKEPGEACDDGNATSGDGCSTLCLNEGSLQPACGDKTVGTGEDCDDGNATSGDGCSATCLAEGTYGGGAVCGNGDVGTGETCDDGNALSGDGCSSQCTKEGSSVAAPYPQCGNGNKEAGEDCDDGNALSGDGCSNQCLREGNDVRCTDPAKSCCGNGKVDLLENCDDGNSAGGDGCSNRCLREGSNARYGFSVVTASYCGDQSGKTPQTLGTGEMCEFQKTGDARPDPSQIARAAFGGTATIEAGVKNSAGADVKGAADFTLVCACTTDASCSSYVPQSSATQVACGKQNCCYKRPEVIGGSPAPNATGVCRNAVVSVRFNTVMDAGTLAGNTFLLVPKTAAACPEGTAVPKVPSGSVIAASYCLAAADLSTLYGVAGEGVTDDVFGAVTELRVTLKRALDPNRQYSLLLIGDSDLTDAKDEGILSAAEVGLAGNVFRSFTAGPDICTIASVSTEPRTWLFSSSQNNPVDDAAGAAFDTDPLDNDKRFRGLATAKPVGGVPQEIGPIAGVYDWTWDWTSSDGEMATPSSWKRIQYPAQDHAQAQTIRTVASPQNGKVTLIAKATVTADVGGGTTGKAFSGKSDITVLICENPWPARQANGSWAPFRETATDFSFSYCRDAGKVHDTTDDLPPPLSDTGSVICAPGQGVCVRPDILLDVLFPLNCAVGAGCNQGDALGFRVLKNADHDRIDKWYARQGFTGEPEATTVDGYPAIIDGRSVYVSAVNKVGDPVLFTNVYLLSSTERSAATTREIVNRVRGTWAFNASLGDGGTCLANVCGKKTSQGCSTDSQCGTDGPCVPVACTADIQCLPAAGGYCDAPKDKLRRDQQRLADFRQIEDALEAYRAGTLHCSITTDRACITAANCPGGESCVGEYPALSSGSYIGGLTTSRWNSWQDTFGEALKTTLPKDPLNVFGTCSGHDPETCFDGQTQSFLCPLGSHVYTYLKHGPTYAFSADFEYLVCDSDGSPCRSTPDCQGGGHCVAPWSQQTKIQPVTPPVGNTLNTWGFADICTGAAISGGAPVCGNGKIETGEECEVGQVHSVACTKAPGQPGYKTEKCDIDCTWLQGATCVTGFCGDGVVNGGEGCDDGQLNGTYGKCNKTCNGASTAGHCGDGTVNGPEVCDLGGRCHFQTTKACASDAECTQIVSGTKDWCTGIAKAGGSNPFASCGLDCKTFGAWCGNKTVEPENGEECELGQVETDAKTCSPCPKDPNDPKYTTGDPDYVWCKLLKAYGNEQIRTRECSPETVNPPVPACKWKYWSNCQPTGYCGNGVKDAGEECDDGNDDNTDSCVIYKDTSGVPIPGFSCKKAVCGDYQVQKGVEVCDLGAFNVNISDKSALAYKASTCAYGTTCQFCTSSCTVSSVSGGFCGDAKVQGGYEQCEAANGPVTDPMNQSKYQGIDLICYPNCQNYCPPAFQNSPNLKWKNTFLANVGNYLDQVEFHDEQTWFLVVPPCRFMDKVALQLTYQPETGGSSPAKVTLDFKPTFGSFAFSTPNGYTQEISNEMSPNGVWEIPWHLLCGTFEQRISVTAFWGNAGADQGVLQIANVTPSYCPLLPYACPDETYTTVCDSKGKCSCQISG